MKLHIAIILGPGLRAWAYARSSSTNFLKLPRSRSANPWRASPASRRRWRPWGRSRKASRLSSRWTCRRWFRNIVSGQACNVCMHAMAVRWRML